MPRIKSAAVVRLTLLELRLDMIADTTTARDQPVAELPPLEIVARQRFCEIALEPGERLNQPLCIERRLGDVSSDMRPCNECRVSQEHNSAEHGSWRYQIENGRKNRLYRAGNNAGDLGRNLCLCRRLPDYPKPNSIGFDQAYMQQLFDYGYQRGRSGILWQLTPSEFGALPPRVAGRYCLYLAWDLGGR